MKFIFSGKAIALYLLILTIYTSIYHPVASWYVVIIDFIGIFYALHKSAKNTTKEESDEILRNNSGYNNIDTTTLFRDSNYTFVTNPKYNNEVGNIYHRD